MSTSTEQLPVKARGMHGTSRQAPFDRWFRYPAGLNRYALQALLAEERNPDAGLVLDPFCGSATVGTAALSKGWDFAGVEAHPEIAELGCIKVDRRHLSGGDLVQAARDAVSSSKPGEADDDEPSLVQRCFDTDVLSGLRGIRDQVRQADESVAPYLKWALLATLRDVANVKVGWPYLRPNLERKPPFSKPDERFLQRVQWMSDDLSGLVTTATGRVTCGSAAATTAWPCLKQKADVCVTSPPYLNNFDYADATRLEMYFWGRNKNWAEMCADVRADMLVATTQQASAGDAKQASERLSTEWPAVWKRVEPLVDELAEARKERKRSKEYDLVLPSYLVSILDVLRNVKANLRSEGWCGWVVGDSAPYGVYVDTPALILTCAEVLGFDSPASLVMRPRGLRWRTNGTRHQVNLDERLIWFRNSSGVQ